MWKGILRGLLRRIVFAAVIGAILYLIQPLVRTLPTLHAIIVILMILFAWEYIV